MNCISNKIIGLSDIECPCFEISKPADFNESESGLFITDIFEIGDLSEMSDCSNVSEWGILNNARKHGILEFQRNYKKIFSQRFKRKLTDCKTQIGSDKLNAGLINTTNQIVGIEVDCRNHTGTRISISQINTFFEATGSVDVYIYSNYNADPLHTITLDTQAGGKKVNKLSETIDLPLYEDGCDDLKYYIIYSFDQLNKPLNNRCSCGCTSKMCFNRYYDMKGVEYAAAPTDFERYDKSLDTCFGLELVVLAYCDETSLICPIDYNSDSGILVAQLVQYEAALFMVAKALTGQMFNYDIETLQRKKGMIKEYLHKRYDDLVHDLSSKDIDCILCKGGARSVRL